MRPQAITTILLTLASTTHSNPARPVVADRQAESPDSFSTAASLLISAYIPPSAYSILSASAAAAASAAGVTASDVNSLIYSALEAPTPPAWWLASAILTVMSAQVSSLTAAIASLAPTGSTVTLPGGAGGSPVATVSVDYPSTTTATTGTTGTTGTGSGVGEPTPTVSQTVVVQTLTDATGGTVTTSFTSAVVVTGLPPSASGSASSGAGGGSSATRAASTSSSTSSAGTNRAAAVSCPTGAIAGVAGLMGLFAAL